MSSENSRSRTWFIALWRVSVQMGITSILCNVKSYDERLESMLLVSSSGSSRDMLRCCMFVGTTYSRCLRGSSVAHHGITSQSWSTRSKAKDSVSEDAEIDELNKYLFLRKVLVCFPFRTRNQTKPSGTGYRLSWVRSSSTWACSGRSKL
jgi:hypothetical protein